MLNSQTELTRMIDAGTVEGVRALLSAGSDPNEVDGSGESPVAVAAMANSIELLELLFRHGAAINGVNSMGWTALHFAVDHVIDTTIQSGARPGDERIEAIEWLVRNGADVRAQAVDGTRPTDISKDYGSERVMGALGVSCAGDV